MIPQKQHRLWLGGVVALCALSYANTLPGAFVLDDRSIISGNPLIRSLGSLPEIFRTHYWAAELAEGDLYRPLTVATYALNYAAGGLDPTGYHAVNIALHALCSVLVFWFLRRVLSSEPAAGFGAVLFAVHPVHTEAVAGVVGRAELLSSAGVLAALCLHLRATSSRRVTAATAACLFAGLLSKENALVFLPLALWIDLLLRRELRDRLGVYAAYGATAVVFLALRWAVLGQLGAAAPSRIDFVDNPLAHAPLLTRWASAVALLGDYLRLALWPHPLSADYSYAQRTATSLPDAPFIATAAVLGALLAVGFRLWRKRRPRLLLLAGLFLIAFSLTANVLFPIGTILAERLLYLPSVAVCGAAGMLWTIGGAGRRGRQAVRWGIAALAGVFLVLTVSRNRDWRDEATLYARTVETSPLSVKARLNYGALLNNQGRYTEAAEQYQRALATEPDYREAVLHLGIAQFNMGNRKEAEASYRLALAIEPRYAEAHRRLGQLLAGQGRLAEAVPALQAAVRLKPVDAEAHNDLGVALQRAGDRDGAIGHYRQAVELDAGFAEAWANLGAALYVTGALAEADGALARACRLDPDNARNWNNLGNVYRAQGRTADARRAYENFLRLWKGDPAYAEAVRAQLAQLP